MLYPKPKMKYSEMAMYVDEHIYDLENQSPEIDEQMFICIYHIIYMLAHKGKYFNSYQYYDDFAAYLASTVFVRLKSPKQFGDNPELKKIKSVLNYIKTVIYPGKVNFEKEFYCQTVVTVDEDDGVYNADYSLADKITRTIEAANVVDFENYLDDIVASIKSFLVNIPYISCRPEWNNIYVSCLLSFLNSVTLRKGSVAKLKSNPDKHDLVDKLYLEEGRDSTILYHLPENMRDYITILTRQIKHIVAKDLSDTIHKHVMSEDSIKDIIFCEVNNLNKTEVKE